MNSAPLVRVRLEDVTVDDLIHLAPCPYTHAHCGTPRGEKPLKPVGSPNCVVCLDLAGNR